MKHPNIIQALMQLKRDPQPEPIRVRVEPIHIEPPREYYDQVAEMDRIATMKAEYMAISDAIDAELSDLETEYQNATERRRPVISKRRLTLYRQRASNTAKLQALDRQIEKIYAETHSL